MKQLDVPIEKENKPEGVFTILPNNNDEKLRKISQISQAQSTASAADFEKAISEAGHGKFNYLILLLAIPASMASSYSVSSLSYILPSASCELNLDSFERGYLNGVVCAGMISSSFFWGYISDKFGRQQTLVLGYLGEAFFSMLATLSQNFWTMFLFKFISGAFICGPFSIFMAYLSELFQAKYRDSVVMMFGLFQALGGIFQALFAWAIIPHKMKYTFLDGLVVVNSWRVFMMMCTLPSFIAGVGIMFCHESPRFLLAKGRKEEALKVFRSIYSINTGRPAHTYSIRKLKRDPHLVGLSRKKSFFEEITILFRPPYLFKSIFAFSIQFGTLFIANTMKLYLPQLFSLLAQELGDKDYYTCEIISGNFTSRTVDCENFIVDESVYYNMLYVMLVTTIFFSISTAVVQKIGKRNLMISLFFLQWLVITPLGWVQPSLTVALAALFIALSNTAFIGLLGFVVQMFPTSSRAMAVCLTMMFGRIGIVFGTGGLPLFLRLSCPGTFVGFGGIALLCGFSMFVLAAMISKSENQLKPPPAA